LIDSKQYDVVIIGAGIFCILKSLPFKQYGVLQVLTHDNGYA